MSSALILDRVAGPWHLGMARAKLQVRGRLPGAFGFDLAADTYRAARRAGIDPADLVPWPSPAAGWSTTRSPRPCSTAGCSPARATCGPASSTSSRRQRPLARAQRARARRAVAASPSSLAHRRVRPRHRRTASPRPAPPAGLSKVLALLCPDTVPLMDPAASCATPPGRRLRPARVAAHPAGPRARAAVPADRRAASGIYVQIVRELASRVTLAGSRLRPTSERDGGRGLPACSCCSSPAATPLANHLATYPAMVLIFAWTSLAFLPWFIALTSYDQIAGDLHLRTIRYAALRTTRGAYVSRQAARAGRAGRRRGRARHAPGRRHRRDLPPGLRRARHRSPRCSRPGRSPSCARSASSASSPSPRSCAAAPAPRGPPPRACCCSSGSVAPERRVGLARRCSRPGTGSPACSTPASSRASSPCRLPRPVRRLHRPRLPPLPSARPLIIFNL
jgi:hypothetical protein